jgi:hypothetical protein
MRLEGPQHLEGRVDNPHNAIRASKEEVFGSGANAADFVILKEGSAFVIWGFDLADFEEVERFPLSLVSRFTKEIFELGEIRMLKPCQ